MKTEKKTHPSYGMIGASRVTGQSYLFGSDFLHHATMRITIRKASVTRDLSRDWPFGEDELIEVELSEAQWATFLSSPNVGHGVPCTIKHINRERVPDAPPPEDRKGQFKSELDEHVREGIAAIQELRDAVAEGRVPKGRTLDLLDKAIRELQPNAEFVSKSFDEQAEKTVEKAKQEIHGYMLGVVHRAGIEHLQNPIALIEGE